MIQINFDPFHWCITIKGHAESAEKGHDLICAAVSALALTLAANLEQTKITDPEKENGCCREVFSSFDDGDCRIRCVPVPLGSLEICTVFDTICTGFRMLAENWPEYVSFDIVSGI